ncbi:MAG: class I tRNA ligase family protein, partial [Deltaproteobacteria bacterium]|nr:class I tRNA ligase family protein [Deltaproteobacteria bacterium]
MSYQSSAGKEEGKEKGSEPSIYALAWTTTPWTLIGNVALAVGADIDYVKIGPRVEGIEKSNFVDVHDPNAKSNVAD